jgi:putative transposase
VKFDFVVKHRATWPVLMICDMLGVSRSGFYARCDRAESARTQADAALVVAIRASFVLSDRTYGARRILRDLQADGHTVGLHHVQRLMRVQALRARPRRRALPMDTGERSVHAIAPNVLDRDFTATAPNQKWVADFTYLWTLEGWLYVAVVLDLFSRRVVGWSMHATMTAQLVTDALLMAVWRRGTPPSDLAHSDQGSQYTSEQFQRALDALGIVCSMSRSGNVWDNAVMESFFSTLKTERTARKQYATRDAARADVFDFLERFYNPIRRHSTLGYVSPMEFEKAVA